MTSASNADVVQLERLRDSLTKVSDDRERAEGALTALRWDRPSASVEWSTEYIGRFTLGSFPTTASFVIDEVPDRLAWHSGFRWCITTRPGVIEWFDLQTQKRWLGKAHELTNDILTGLTARGFAETGRLEPKGVTFDAGQQDFSVDPSQQVAKQIKDWWVSSCQYHLSDDTTRLEQHEHKIKFTRFVAGVLLLRTIEDMDCVSWLRPGRLYDAVRDRAPATQFGAVARAAAERLNSRVLAKIQQDLSVQIKRQIVSQSYDLGVNFAALDVDPVGLFYEEILGIEYEPEFDAQRDLFGYDLRLLESRKARRAHGVYFTPRIYADTLARKLVRPAIRAAQKVSELPVITDIAAGSGELLCAALRELVTEPYWRRADVVWTMLDSKFQAVDINPLAPQLCALNLLRTAIRYVPELLSSNKRLPSLEKNVVRGNALHCATLDGLGKSDIVIINPPFHAPNKWTPPPREDACPELYDVPQRPNEAIAFFVSALRAARDNAGLGVVMPSNLFGGPNSDAWRRWLAKRVNLEFVAANFGTPFRDVYSYAGLVIGRKRGTDSMWRPKTRLIQISGSIDAQSDTGVLLSAESHNKAVAKSVVPPLTEESQSWLIPPKTDSRVPGAMRQLRASLLSVMGDTFHQGIGLAPEPWDADLFLFEKIDHNTVRHLCTDKAYPFCARLRPLAMAKRMKRLPLWSEPTVADLFVYLPADVGTESANIRALKSTDVDSWRIGNAIIREILKKDESSLSSPESKAFYKAAEQRELYINVPRSYEWNTKMPLVYAARASVTPKSMDNAAWYGWLAVEGNAVPVSGLQLRAQKPSFAAVLLMWMSLREVIEPLSLLSDGTAAARRDGSVEFYLKKISAWSIPDLREDRLQARIDECFAAFLEYRSEALALTRTTAFQLRSYYEARALAKSLWEES